MNRITQALLVLVCLASAVTGVVVDHLSNPLAGVRVQFAIDGSSTATGADGSFTLTPAPTGTLPHPAQFNMSVAGNMLSFTLAQAEVGSIRTFDILGHQVNSWASQSIAAGEHQYAPLGNARQAPGIYIVQYQFGFQKGVVTMAVTSSQGGVVLALASTAKALRLQPATMVDTVYYNKTGLVTQGIAIADYTASLGQVVMDSVASSSSGTVSSSVEVSSSVAVSSSSSIAVSSSSATPSSSNLAVSSSSVVASSSTAGISYGILTDARDGKTYKTVVIGTQTWMAQNLNYTPSSGTYTCAPSCSLYGMFYDWSTALSVCPAGWHLPDTTEWGTLVTFAGGSAVAGYNLKSSATWSRHPGIDMYGFSALAAGWDFAGGMPQYQGSNAYWWTSVKSPINGGWARETSTMDTSLAQSSLHNMLLLSVRCLKDSVDLQSSSSMASSSSTISSSSGISFGALTDTRDGQNYKTIVLGTQTWMAQNLNYSGDNGSGARTYTKGWCYGVGGTDTTRHQDSTSCASDYGRLYTWADVMSFSNTYLTIQTTAGMITTPHQGICPTGWHVPTQAAWDSLATFIRTDKSVTSGNEGKYLKGIINPNPNSWITATNNAQDPYGFTALPAGYRSYVGGWFDRTNSAYFWTAGESNASSAWLRTLYDFSANLYAYNFNKGYGQSLRCLKDSP